MNHGEGKNRAMSVYHQRRFAREIASVVGKNAAGTRLARGFSEMAKQPL